MRILYFDCFNGASGDMILGALLDAGLPLQALRDALGSLGLAEYELAADRVLRAGVSATQFRLIERANTQSHATPSHRAHSHAAPSHHHHDEHPHSHEHGHSHDHDHEHEHPHEHSSHSHTHDAPRTANDAPSHHHAHRSLPEILSLIAKSALSEGGRLRASALFQRLAEAEAAIHQMPVERVHLHEVGALDSIIDIVGAVFALEWFKADRIVVSPLNVGGGMVHSAHGVFPVPAPATVRLLGSAPIYSQGPRAELLTPTGALLLTGHADAFGPLPPMQVTQVGYGAGQREFADTPNVLRVLLGESAESASTERIVELTCETDDMNPQIFGVLMDRLYQAGALEVFYQAVQMKKNRPGTMVTVLAAPSDREALSMVLFRETTTIGVRYQEMDRDRLDREIVTIDTPLGAVRMKLARRGGIVLNAAPEFEDCARLAQERGLPVKDVQAAVTKAWLDRRTH